MEENGMLEAASNLNGTIWVFTAILIGIVLVQSFLFARLALRFNKKNKLVTDGELKQAVQTGAVSAIGPSFSSLVIAISLITIVGSATTYMRCGVIGAPTWELMMANLAASAAGITFGEAGISESIFVLCLFGMILGSAPYFINTIITLKPLDLAVEKTKESNKKISFIPYLSNAAMAAVLGYCMMDYLSSVAAYIGLFVAAAVLYGVNCLAKKTGNSFLGSCNMAIAMLVGMTVAQCVNLMIS
jgi:hypothetical protein